MRYDAAQVVHVVLVEVERALCCDEVGGGAGEEAAAVAVGLLRCRVITTNERPVTLCEGHAMLRVYLLEVLEHDWLV